MEYDSLFHAYCDLRYKLKCFLDLLIHMYVLAYKPEMYEENDNQLKSEMRSVKM